MVEQRSYPENPRRGTMSYPSAEERHVTSRSLTPVLVVSPHPDDAESGAGGIVAHWAEQGRKVVMVVCTNGDKGSANPDMNSRMLAEIREREQREAAEVLGVSEVVFLGFPDQELEDSYDLREKITRQIRIHQPETVVTVDPNLPYIIHPDHYTTGRVTLNCVFPYARDRLAFPEHERDGLNAHKVREIYLWGGSEPDTFLEVTETFETKLEALSRHRSQVSEGWELREVRARSRYEEVGRKIGVPYAEAFKRIEIF